MRAISLHQPWASLIASGEKTIETRRWPTKYRGDLLICSTKRKNKAFPNLPLGQALCIVEVVGCRPMERSDAWAACCQWYEGAFAWELANIRSISPFPVTGRQGFYDVDLASSRSGEISISQ